VESPLKLEDLRVREGRPGALLALRRRAARTARAAARSGEAPAQDLEAQI